MAKICLCLTAKTIKRNLEILNKYRKFTDIAELRVDCLDSDERLYIRRFPEQAGLPVILTIRRDIDGGHFVGGEGARVKLFANGLAYASADSRQNFAYVDIEDDLEVPSLEEAARTFGTRIIRSYHNISGVIDDIPAKLRSMRQAGDEIIKMALTVKSTSDVLQIYQASKTFSANKTYANQEKIIICMGHYGIYSRILAERFGSFLTYCTALSEDEISGAPGQMDISDLEELYRFRKITKNTKVYGIAGYPLLTSVSPWFFNTVFNIQNTDAVYVPFPVDSINEFLEIADKLDVQGLSITVPYKEAVLPALNEKSDTVKSIGACNTMHRFPGGWFGENTDCTGFTTSFLEFINRKNLKSKKITIIGAGGVAKSVAAEVFRLGGKALVLNRTVLKAKNLAEKYNFRWGGLPQNGGEGQGFELMSKYNDIIIQASSAGMDGYEAVDPMALYTFTGKETVMDLVYTPARTPFLERAAAAGCRTINGYDMVIKQACQQYVNFFGTEINKQLLTRLNTMGANAWNKIRSS